MTALAFCDYNELQELRRRLLRPHTLPYSGAPAALHLQRYVLEECQHLVAELHRSLNQDVFGVEVDLKFHVLKACSNVFNRYFCHGDKRFDYGNARFADFVENFDRVFWEVNQTRIADIIPWMEFTCWNNIRETKVSIF